MRRSEERGADDLIAHIAQRTAHPIRLAGTSQSGFATAKSGSSSRRTVTRFGTKSRSPPVSFRGSRHCCLTIRVLANITELGQNGSDPPTLTAARMSHIERVNGDIRSDVLDGFQMFSPGHCHFLILGVWHAAAGLYRTGRRGRVEFCATGICPGLKRLPAIGPRTALSTRPQRA